MRRKTRRRFLAEAAGAAAGTFVWTGVCVGVGPKLLTGTRTALAADAGPSMRFPAVARERIAIASYPFRDFIAGLEDKSGGGELELKEVAGHVSAKFNIKKIEAWSEHFHLLDQA